MYVFRTKNTKYCIKAWDLHDCIQWKSDFAKAATVYRIFSCKMVRFLLSTP